MRTTTFGSWNSCSRSDWPPRSSQPDQSERERLAWLQLETGETETIPVAKGTNRRSRKLARLEAVLFVAEGALSARKLAQFATLADFKEAEELIEQLNASYELSRTSFRVECVAGGYRLLTQPQFAVWLDKLHDRQAEVQLSPPAMETLTIVAYRQPVTRADVEAVRGVQSSEILKLLMEKGLVRITGEEDSLGRPYLYGTTNAFLEAFGLGTLKDLPMREEFAPATPEDPQQEFEFEEAEEVAESDSEEVELEESEQEEEYEIATIELGEPEEEDETVEEYAEEEYELETLETEETWEETDDEDAWDDEEYEDDEEAA